MVKKAETNQDHFTLENEGLRIQRKLQKNKKSTWISTWETINNIFMVLGGLHQAHLQGVGVMQISAHHVNGSAFGMRSKGPYNYMIIVFDLCVKWAKVLGLLYMGSQGQFGALTCTNAYMRLV